LDPKPRVEDVMLALTPGLSALKLMASFGKAADTARSWPQFAARSVAFTQSCRTAIALLSAASGLKPGDEVLLSAYNCGTEVDALLAAGLQIRCIECDEQGFLPIERLKHEIGPRTRAIYVIHLFGWPQPLDEIDAWRKQHGLVLLEDCALALFSETGDGVPLGTLGEASVFSFPKTLPTPDGGAVSWGTNWPGPGELGAPPAKVAWRQTASKIRQWARRRPGRAPASTRNLASSGQETTQMQVSDMPQHYYFERWRAGRGCAPVTLRLLGQCDHATVRERRRANYRVLSSLLTGGRFDLVFSELPDGVCPLSCTVRIGQRDAILAGLAQRGIDIPPWWAGGHSAIEWSRFPVASRLKHTLLPLPVHHGLGPEDMEYIAEAVFDVCKQVDCGMSSAGDTWEAM
jgi:perosamine synthetase